MARKEYCVTRTSFFRFLPAPCLAIEGTVVVLDTFCSSRIPKNAHCPVHEHHSFVHTGSPDFHTFSFDANYVLIYKQHPPPQLVMPFHVALVFFALSEELEGICRGILNSLWFCFVNVTVFFASQCLWLQNMDVLLHFVCVLSRCLTLCNPMDCSLPGSSICGIFQARILEWVAISYSTGSSRPRDQNCVSCVSCLANGFFFTTVPPGKFLLHF